MQPHHRPLIFGFLIICFVAFIGGNALRQYLKPERTDLLDVKQVSLGKLFYERQCASCHGINLEGQRNWRAPKPDGSLKAPPHDQTGHTWHHHDEFIVDYTKRGGQANAPEGFNSNMPAFADVLEDYEIWAILAYIKSRWPEAIQQQQQQLNRDNSRSFLSDFSNEIFGN